MGPGGAGAEEGGGHEVGLEGQAGEKPREEGELRQLYSNNQEMKFLLLKVVEEDVDSEDEMEMVKRQRKLAKKEKKLKEDMKLEKILRKEEKVPYSHQIVCREILGDK